MVLAALTAVFSCEIPFPLDDVSDPAIYIEYLPSTELEARMMVAYAEPAFGKPGSVRYDFSASDVELKINDKSVPVTEVTDEDKLNLHTLSLPEGTVLSPGDRIDMKVTGRHGVPSASASTTIPARPLIKSVDFKQITKDSTDAWQVSMKLDRPVADGEYYGIKAAKRYTFITASGPDIFHIQLDTMVSVNYFSPGQVATFADLNNLDLDSFASVSYKDGFITSEMYSDQALTLLASKEFEGDTYSFYVNADGLLWEELDFGFLFDDEDSYEELFEDDEPQYAETGDDEDVDYDWPEEPEDPGIWVVVSETSEYSFEIFRLSDEFYNYAKAQYLATFNMLSNFGVSPPNFTYTNVLGGLGVVAGLSGSATGWMKTPEWVKEE